MTKFWMGSPPVKCDICHKPITDTFIDGATNMGPWANMCPSCYHQFGRGLGQGSGQKYTRIEKGGQVVWVKVEG